MKDSVIAAGIVMFIGFGLLIMLITGEKVKPFSGYIPIEEKPLIKWVKVDDSFDQIGSIMVIISEKDSIVANFRIKVPWSGIDYVLYKNEYPPTIGKIVFVNGYYDNKGVAFIREASIEHPKQVIF